MHSDRSGPPLVFVHFFFRHFIIYLSSFCLLWQSSPATCFLFFLHNLPSYQSPFLAAPHIQPVCCSPAVRSSTWVEARFVLINFRESSPSLCGYDCTPRRDCLNITSTCSAGGKVVRYRLCGEGLHRPTVQHTGTAGRICFVKSDYKVKEFGGRTWTGLIWLRIRANRTLLRRRYWTFGFHKWG